MALTNNHVATEDGEGKQLYRFLARELGRRKGDAVGRVNSVGNGLPRWDVVWGKNLGSRSPISRPQVSSQRKKKYKARFASGCEHVIFAESKDEFWRGLGTLGGGTRALQIGATRTKAVEEGERGRRFSAPSWSGTRLQGFAKL